tara:strand:+ start:8370 stop:9842 length:1473 start_codon:yes stop_codon:yes gene_type:complete
MQHFYDGQIRRYVTQMVRLMSNFSVKDGSGTLKQVPVMYGDLTRQVASIIRDNSENKIPSAPRMAVYINSLEMDRSRTADASYVSKVNIRERAYDENNEEYLNTQGKNYTVERLMPTPYTLGFTVDIWSSNTDQKLQIMEQILTLFNPSLEIQTTDNYIDWTSLSVVNMEGITFSSRSIPVGVDSDIDVANMTFTTPIYLSPPIKVKRLGVITNIITSVFNEDKGTIDLSLSRPELKAYDDSVIAGSKPTTDGNTETVNDSNAIPVNVSHKNYGIYITGTMAQLVANNRVGSTNWRNVIDTYPGQYQDDISRLYIRRSDENRDVTGTISLNPNDETQLMVNWDLDSFPSNTIINGPTRLNAQWTSIDYIIDPLKTNPITENMRGLGSRILLLNDIGDADNGNEGPSAWDGNFQGTDLVASKDDIVEWDGNQWRIVFDASENKLVYNDEVLTTVYTTNLKTGIQYRWDGSDWLLSVEGLYPNGTWRLSLNG